MSRRSRSQINGKLESCGVFGCSRTWYRSWPACNPYCTMIHYCKRKPLLRQISVYLFSFDGVLSCYTRLQNNVIVESCVDAVSSCSSILFFHNLYDTVLIRTYVPMRDLCACHEHSHSFTFLELFQDELIKHEKKYVYILYPLCYYR